MCLLSISNSCVLSELASTFSATRLYDSLSDKVEVEGEDGVSPSVRSNSLLTLAPRVEQPTLLTNLIG